VAVLSEAMRLIVLTVVVLLHEPSAAVEHRHEPNVVVRRLERSAVVGRHEPSAVVHQRALRSQSSGRETIHDLFSNRVLRLNVPHDRRSNSDHRPNA
jgi:hypothetical protein